ncbi:MAG: M20/M25/M40 family metallo-hydrolase [Vicinamibacterales bacterium]
MNPRAHAAMLLAATLAIPVLAAAPWAQTPSPTTPAARSAEGDRVDLDAIYRIKDEGLQRSQVMDTVWYLTEVHGPRLTNSPNIRAAAAWATDRLAGWGLSRVRLETWGPFGRGWVNEKFTANVLTPQPWPLIAFPRAWTPGTEGSLTGEAVIAVIDREEDFQKWTGKLNGKVVLAARATTVTAPFSPTARRLSDQELVDLQAQPVQAPRGGGRGGNPPPNPNFNQKRMVFYGQEGVLAVLEPGVGRGDHGAILVAGSSRNRDAKEPLTAPQIAVAAEQYNRLVRLVEKNVPVTLEIDARNRFVDDTADAFNILAEIPGTDKADEVVMLGAHFDSWHAGAGATDNAAGSAAMMEAVRILKVTGVRLRRTVRLALWTGEEQGLLGSRAYVKQQFGDPDTMALKPAHAKVSAYFNMDNGTGAIRGVYLQGNEAVRPIFSAWMEPFRNLGMTTLTIRNTGGTDHVAFDELGLPGFQFVQDPIEYFTDSHHSNMDLYDRIQPEDLMKNAVIIASFVYHAANRDDLLPRKTLPKPRPATSSQ